VRRHRRVYDDIVPRDLRVFDPRQWAGDPLKWFYARYAFQKANPGAWPHPLAVFAGYFNVSAKLSGHLPPHPQYDEGSS
jgi:hypothetical protein